jgi:hypothetical protein
MVAFYSVFVALDLINYLIIKKKKKPVPRVKHTRKRHTYKSEPEDAERFIVRVEKREFFHEVDFDET